jgi:hypothetical protein
MYDSLGLGALSFCGLYAELHVLHAPMSQRCANLRTLAVLTLTSCLVRYGSFPDMQHLFSLIGPLLSLLDGRVDEVDNHDGVSESVLEGSITVCERSVMVRCRRVRRCRDTRPWVATPSS